MVHKWCIGRRSSRRCSPERIQKGRAGASDSDHPAPVHTSFRAKSMRESSKSTWDSQRLPRGKTSRWLGRAVRSQPSRFASGSRRCSPSESGQSHHSPRSFLSKYSPERRFAWIAKGTTHQFLVHGAAEAGSYPVGSADLRVHRRTRPFPRACRPQFAIGLTSMTVMNVSSSPAFSS
jgi:hypothetical protein